MSALDRVGCDLRPVARLGLPGRRDLRPERRVEPPLRAARRRGEHGPRPRPAPLTRHGVPRTAPASRRRRAVRRGRVQRAPDRRETGRIGDRQLRDEAVERAQAVLVRDRDRMRGVEPVDDAAPPEPRRCAVPAARSGAPRPSARPGRRSAPCARRGTGRPTVFRRRRHPRRIVVLDRLNSGARCRTARARRAGSRSASGPPRAGG